MQKESEKEYIYMYTYTYIYESLCCTPKTNVLVYNVHNIVNQLNSSKI